MMQKGDGGAVITTAHTLEPASSPPAPCNMGNLREFVKNIEKMSKEDENDKDFGWYWDFETGRKIRPKEE